MLDTETALPEASEQLAGASDQPADAPVLETDAKPEGDAEAKATKPEKTEAERIAERMQRGIDRKTRQAAEARAEARQLREELDRLRSSSIGDTNRSTDGDSGKLTLSPDELEAEITKRAQALAPKISQQAKVIEHRAQTYQAIEAELGVDNFKALADDLEDAFGGPGSLIDKKGAPAPVIEAIFEAEKPAELIKYLADEDNADEAEALARMSPIQVGRAIAKLESRLAAKKASDKPQRSNAPAPIESVKASGVSSEPDESRMTDAQFSAYREKMRRRA